MKNTKKNSINLPSNTKAKTWPLKLAYVIYAAIAFIVMAVACSYFAFGNMVGGIIMMMIIVLTIGASPIILFLLLLCLLYGYKYKENFGKIVILVAAPVICAASAFLTMGLPSGHAGFGGASSIIKTITVAIIISVLATVISVALLVRYKAIKKRLKISADMAKLATNSAFIILLVSLVAEIIFSFAILAAALGMM